MPHYRWGAHVPLAETMAPARFEHIEIGRVFSASEAFGHSEMDQFAALSGDVSSIHTDAKTARQFGFRDRIQYGFLLTTLLSRIVGANFEHAVCAAVSVDFTKPVLAGERVQVRAEVTQVQEAIRSVVLRITVLGDGGVVARGKLTTVFLPEI